MQRRSGVARTQQKNTGSVECRLASPKWSNEGYMFQELFLKQFIY